MSLESHCSWILFHCPIITGTSVDELLRRYPDFVEVKERQELQYLLAFRNIIRIALLVIPPLSNKQLLLNIGGRLEGSGNEYITGTSQKICVTRRVIIYEQEGSIAVQKKKLQIPHLHLQPQAPGPPATQLPSSGTSTCEWVQQEDIAITTRKSWPIEVERKVSPSDELSAMKSDSECVGREDFCCKNQMGNTMGLPLLPEQKEVDNGRLPLLLERSRVRPGLRTIYTSRNKASSIRLAEEDITELRKPNTNTNKDFLPVLPDRSP